MTLIHHRDLVETLHNLVAINSVNASYEGGPGEYELAAWIESLLLECGLPCERRPVIAASSSHRERFNVLSRLPGKRSDTCFVLEAHMDTVSVDGMQIPPFTPTISNGRLYGRGACDTKAGLAAMLCAFAEFSRLKSTPPVDILLACVVDEEYSFRGVSKLCEGLHAMGAIVAEPTELRIVTASKGVLRWKVITHGIAAHSAKCHLGANAIYPMGTILSFFEEEHQQLAQRSPYPLLGTPSINVGCIHGGVQVNFVPDRCEIEIDRRLLPGEEPMAVWEDCATRLKERIHGRNKIELEVLPPYLVDPAWSAPEGDLFVMGCQQAARSLGLDDNPMGVPFGSDASKLGRIGIPTIIFGPGSIDQAHAAVEYVELSQVENAYQFYLEVMRNLGQVSA